MKLKYIFASIAAVCAVISSCKKAEVGADLAEYQVSNSFISIPKEGGEVKINLNATVDWCIDTTGSHKWLTVTPIAGAPGTYTISFKADSTAVTNCDTLYVANYVNDKKQTIYVTQQAEVPEVKESTCADVIAGVNGKTYRVTGIVSKIVDAAVYGNWYITDETGTVYVYGTRNADGELKKGALISYGIEVGDKVTIEGERATYNTTIELKEVYVLGITKSLIQMLSESEQSAEAEGDTVSVKLLRKGNNLDISTSESWLSILSTQTIPAVGTDPVDTTVVNLLVAPNDGKGRSATATFSSSLDGQTSEISMTVNQLGGNIDIIDVVEGQSAHVIGVVTAISTKGLIITDKTASIFYFNKNYVAGTYAIGDQLDIKCSKVSAYNKGLQLDIANITKIEKVGEETVSYPAPKVLDAAAIDEIVTTTTNNLAEYVSLVGELSISGNYLNIKVDGTTNQGSIYNITSDLKDQLVSGKTYDFKGYLMAVSGSSTKYPNIIVTDAAEATVYNKVTALTSGKSYLMVFADTLALNHLASDKTYGYPSASACKASNGKIVGSFADCEYIFTSVEGGYNMKEGGEGGRFIYLYKDGGKSFNVAAAIPATPENCGVWNATFDAAGIATISNLMDSSWIQYSPKYTSAGSYKTAQDGAILPVLYEKQ